MPARYRRRFASSIRLLALVLFALALILRPVVDSLGEMHEFAHGGHGRSEQVSPPRPADSVAKSTAGEGKQASTLHTLLNFAHCCGTTLATLPEPALAPLALAAAAAPAWADRASPRAMRRINPFRPPITA